MSAAAQGALALQCRADDAATRQIAAVMDDPTTRQCVAAERMLVRALNGDCHSPIAAYATLDGDTMTLRGALGQPDGALPVKRGAVTGKVTEFQNLAAALSKQLR